MDKKRRDFVNCEVIDLSGAEIGINQVIAVQTNCDNDGKIVYSKHHVLPKYGCGCITNFQFDDLLISISRYKLVKDLIIKYDCDDDFTQLSFLLEGEKIISIRGVEEDIPIESHESYIANINKFKGYVRVSGVKAFKEIKIKLSKLFLLNHGFSNDFIFKKFSDKDLILPITNELFTVLTNLEDINLKGISRKIFMEAKVLELLAIQMENYKVKKPSDKIACTGKIIRKLYAVHHILKNNLDKNYSIKQLSQEVALNENLLKKEYKRVFGFSMNEFCKQEKMNKAKELLRSSQLPIYQIAEDTGYKNATHFSAAFKKYFGETPKQYREIL
ncbi:helix-turn-helix transcriptional regulator [Lutibacter flavus]|uniref:Transcriptional regulator, AraC family n=1 Tax=Lutibacter flavus TaxID=691689 RepID=A0A238Z2Z6_9FLAO|nr:AraC family transcriptional regulator [Lutibacter flavus]SNR77726.1 transcriptional regulator, AraC family [Lutibacter flavus]